MIEKRVYKTADMWLAATLMIKGMKVIGVEVIPEKKRHEIYRFIFEDIDTRSAIVLEYTGGGCLVEPKTLGMNVRSLKQMIKDQRQEEGNVT